MRRFSLLLLLLAGSALPALAAPSHGIAMQGEPALPADFDHLPYANPDAPKGGRISYGWPGTFDSMNPFIVQGSAARGQNDLDFGFNVFDTLMMRSMDEPFTLYPLVAKTIETDDARSFVEFTLDERARFSDGVPVTPEDVIFTVELLRDHGLPRYGVTAKKIERIEKVGEHGVRFTFKDPDRELPLILGLLPVLPKHAIDPERFGRSSLTPLIGSGPYRVTNVRPGDSITLTRNPDYWAKDIPSKRGFDNYDEIRLTYYRDENAMFEAFKGGLLDVFIEGSSGRWRSQYNFPAVQRGDVVQDTFRTGRASGMFGFVMNTRRPVFADPAFREALSYLFDFEWANRNLLGNAYTRTKSFFDNSDLSSYGVPASAAERALLAPFPNAVKPEILDHGWQPPVSDGTGRDRKFLRAGFERLKAAGYSMANGRMVDKAGRPLSFEIMLKARDAEGLALAWQSTLARLGIAATVRSVDASQYQQRLNTYDFDTIAYLYTPSLSPGVEQVSRWGSASADVQGTFNYSGAANPAADAMIGAMLQARDRDSFRDAVRAYDRVLLSSSYVVPLYYLPEQWLGRWKRIERPAKAPIYGYQLPTWWRAEATQ